jgi:MFS family permease
MTSSPRGRGTVEREASRHGLNLLLASTAVAVSGQGMVVAAAPLLAASLTSSPLAVSAVAAASPAAWLVMGLPAGALVDRLSRRRVMVLTDAMRAVLLAFLTASIVLGFASIPLLVLVIFLVGVGSSFFDPAAQAAIPQVVGRDARALSRANGKLWAIDTFGRGLVGPPLGAVLFGLAAALPFGVEAGTFAASAALLLGLPHDPRPVGGNATSLTGEIREGLGFLFHHTQLRALTIGMASYNLGFNIAFATLVLFVKASLNVSGAGYGLLVAVMALGGIAGGWIAPRIADHLSAIAVYAVALLLQALAWLAVGLTQNLALTVGCLVLVGMASTTVSVVGGSARQILTPDHLLGRLMSVTRLFGIGAAAIGSLVGGAVASLWGLASPFIAATIVLGLAGVAFAAARRR